jgi:N-acetylmuramic acid 6-phosphate etherase
VTAADELGRLATEAHRPELGDLDLRPTRELVGLMNEADATVASAVSAAALELADAIDAIADRLRRGGRLVYVGAGTSGRIAALDAEEIGPTFSVPDAQIVALTADSDAAEDDAPAGAADVRDAQVDERDAAVAVSASGRTPYTLGAVLEARGRSALTVAVACVPDSELARACDHAITAVVGAELVAGSTRLKAGTAQKLILNTISTVTMIRLGKTYGNLMVDVRAGNEKLRARARRTVELATGADPDAVDAALTDADGVAKVAIVSLLLGVGSEEARTRLESAGGALRGALAS